MYDLKLPHITAYDTDDKLNQFLSYFKAHIEELNYIIGILDRETKAEPEAKEPEIRYASDIEKFVKTCGKGSTPFYVDANTSGLPLSGTYTGAVGLVLKNTNNYATVLLPATSGALAIKAQSAGTWTAWKTAVLI